MSSDRLLVVIGLQLEVAETEPEPEPEEEVGAVGAWERLLRWVEAEHGVKVRQSVEALEIVTAGGAPAR